MKGKRKEEMSGAREAVTPKFVSVAEAEQLTGVSRWTWRQMCYSGRIESIKIGRRLLISLSEIDRVVAEGRRPRAQMA
jgi:excisionase family DNA binding protein